MNFSVCVLTKKNCHRNDKVNNYLSNCTNNYKFSMISVPAFVVLRKQSNIPGYSK